MPLTVAILTSDKREPDKDYGNPAPGFGTAPEALLQGLATLPELEVHVVSCLQQRVQAPAKLADNIWYHGLYVPKIGWLRTLYQGCICATRKKLREIKPDIVHGQGTERDCSISAILSGYPSVVTIHGNMAELARFYGARPGTFGWLTARFEDFTLRRTAGVFCNSEYTERLVKSRARRVWRVSNPIRREFFSPAAGRPVSEKCILVNVGVICPRKRQLELLEVAHRLHAEKLNFEFHFIGDAPAGESYAAAFLEKIKPMEAEGYVRYIGQKTTSELVAHFDRSAAAIHFPSEEAFGLVVAESLARNLKFFGARVGGIVDIAGGVEGAELFASHDIAGLGMGIGRWIKAGYPQPLGAAAIMRERYAPERIALRHLEIYREVLGRPS